MGDQGVTVNLTAERDTAVCALVAHADANQPAARGIRPPAQRPALLAWRSSREPETLRQEAVRGHYNQARGLSLATRTTGWALTSAWRSSSA